MNQEKWSPPKWMYRDRRPSKDDAYFENMTRVIFLAGLSWKMIGEKWPNFKKVFKDFSIDAVARFAQKDVERLMEDKGIVRNRMKIAATIDNAKEFQNIRTECGSFQSYLDSLDKSKSYAIVMKELGKRFKRLGPSSARIFLYSVGEDVKPAELR